MKLYDMELSGNCYKVRLFCSLLGVNCESIPVDLMQGEHREAAFLVYLARKHGGDRWLPLDAAAMASVMQWLAVSENEILYGLARARAITRFNRPWELAPCQALGRAGLAVMERHLGHQPWLATDRPTIADIACYPYVALAPEGGVALDEVPEVRQWIARICALPGYIGMPGL